MQQTLNTPLGPYPAPYSPEQEGVRGQSSDKGQQDMAFLPGTQDLTSVALHFSFFFVPPHTGSGWAPHLLLRKKH